MTTSRHPDEMPCSFHNDADELRNCLMTLHTFPCVDIHWEQNMDASNALGEIRGKWEVNIVARSGTFRAEHSELTNALWFAFTCAEKYNDDEYERRSNLRQAALAKLTKEERKELGL